MKIYLSVDLEGIHGVDRYDRHELKKPEYWEWKRKVGELMREEVEALYHGLQARGIEQVYVLDSHGHENTLKLTDKSQSLIQVRRDPSHNTNFPFLDGTFVGIILWGYHVKAGSAEGKLAHTASRRIQYIKING
jgi:D-amino peptidase